jgi:predicted porin
MKKSLFALAALGAFATAAQAQSTVTLYGNFDTSVAYLTGLQAATASTITNASNSITTGDGFGYIDSSWATSSWGMRGSEDLGGGMKANFHLESDTLTNTGNTHSSGLFRRAANVSLADAKLGEVFLGRRGSAYILATGQMLPVSGNTAHQWRNVILSSVGDQISNSVTYATPTIMATNAVVQYGMNNTVDNGDDGSVFAAHLVNKSINNLQFTAAYNTMKGVRAASTANASAANATTGNREGYAVGLKYKVTPTIEVGAVYNHGRNNNGGSAGVATTNQSTGQGLFGVGYQAASNILLGANYGKTTFQAQMINLQAHYLLSKRTRVYSQITLTKDAQGNNQVGGTLANNYSPVFCNSSSTPTVCNSALASSSSSAKNSNPSISSCRSFISFSNFVSLFLGALG